jgi:alpha-galactosidase
MQAKITFKDRHWNFIFSSVLLFLSITGFTQTYEAENGILAGNANIQTCDSCSGSIVGNLSDTSTVTLTVNVLAAGWYNMSLFYATADPRSFRITSGNGPTLVVPVPVSAGWSTTASLNVRIYLNDGNTDVVFGSPSYGPNLDKITLSPVTSTQLQAISFGSNSQIVYNINSKTYNIVLNGVTVISEASAFAKGNQSNISTGYSDAAYTSENFTDNIGTGTKHIFTLSGGFTNNMQQIFYTYDNQEYITVQVRLTGSGSNCYQMSPLTSYNVSPDLGGGDTRALFVPYDNDAWIRYNANSLSAADFTGSEVTNIYSNDSRHGLVIGSIDNSHWKTGITVLGGGTSSAYVSVINGYIKNNLTRDPDNPDNTPRLHGWVNVGMDYCDSPKILISADDDWRTAFETYGEVSALSQPKYTFNWTAAKPMGWNSWGVIGDDINLVKAKAVSDFFETEVPSFRTEDNTVYLDLDSYWDNMTDAQLAEFAAYCTAKGFKPGIYWAPFVDWGGFARPIEGSSYNYSQTWTKVNNATFRMSGALAMDPTHPATQARITHFINRFINAGFKMVKFDFLIHASIEADSYYDWQVHTGMEAYHQGMKFLTDAVGDNMLIEASICPNMSTGPYAHIRRIACDAYMHGAIGDTEYTLNSMTYGWWQNKMYDYLDADGVVFNNTVDGVNRNTEGINRARYTSSIVTGTITLSDDYSTPGPWVTRAQSILQNPEVLAVAKADMHFKPADGNTGNTASRIFYATVNDITYVAIFNYGTTGTNENIDLARIGLSGSYTATELYSGVTITGSNSLAFNLPASDAHLYKITGATAGTDADALLRTTSFLYPNPASNSFRVKFASPVTGNATVTISDLGGKKIYSTIVNVDGTTSAEISAGALAKGFYVVTVATSQGTLNLKFIKQ